jgi:hypothetical protein
MGQQDHQAQVAVGGNSEVLLARLPKTLIARLHSECSDNRYYCPIALVIETTVSTGSFVRFRCEEPTVSVQSIGSGEGLATPMAKMRGSRSWCVQCIMPPRIRRKRTINIPKPSQAYKTRTCSRVAERNPSHIQASRRHTDVPQYVTSDALNREGQ